MTSLLLASFASLFGHGFLRVWVRVTLVLSDLIVEMLRKRIVFVRSEGISFDAMSCCVLDNSLHQFVHFSNRFNHVRRASISSQSKVGVEGRFLTQLLVQALIGLPVTITIVEGSVFKEIFKVHRVVNSGAVVSILMTDLLEGIHSLDTARYHLRNCADTEISALLDHLTELFLDILAPRFNL